MRVNNQEEIYLPQFPRPSLKRPPTQTPDIVCKIPLTHNSPFAIFNPPKSEFLSIQFNNQFNFNLFKEGIVKKMTRRQVISLGASAVAGAVLIGTASSASAESTKNRPLRRKDRALTEEQAREVIENTKWAVLSTADTDGNPYGVPVSPVLAGNVIYFHGTKLPGGRKADNMLMNPNVSLCYVAKANYLPESFTIDYASAVVTGKARPITSKEEEAVALKHILARLAPGNSAERNEVYKKHFLARAMFWKVEIENITGKARMAAKWEKGKSVHEVQDVGPIPVLEGVPK